MSYQIALEVFEGPFDLLLDLILKQKVDIYEIPIARITDDYLKYLTKMEELNLEVTSEFLVIAATLIELKSIALLPVDEEERGLEEAAEETRDSLIEHLIDYKTFQTVAQELYRRGEMQSHMFPREVPLDPDFADIAPDFLEGIRLSDLAALAQELLEVKPGFQVDTSHIYAFHVSLAEKTDEIMKAISNKKSATFRELCEGMSTKVEKIIVFLALLELFKRGEIVVTQARMFGDIRVKLEGK